MSVECDDLRQDLVVADVLPQPLDVSQLHQVIEADDYARVARRVRDADE